MLILAGVSISIIVGDNGIIKQAQTAKDKTDLANAKTAVETAVATLQTEYMSEKTTNANKDISETFTVGSFNKELQKLGYELRGLTNFENTASIFKTETGDMAKFKTQIKSTKASDDTIYDVIITRKNKSSVVIGKEVTIAVAKKDSYNLPGIDKIGNSYNYSVTLPKTSGTRTIDNWRVFWADEEGTYIITTDYLPIDVLGLKETEGTIANKVGLTTDGTYRVWWADGTAVQNQISDINSKFLSKYHKYTLNGSNPNSRAVSTLLNTNNWSKFAEGKGGKWAIGGPTLEMWMASWNEKTKNDEKKSVISCSSDGSTNGYKMKIDLSNFTLPNNNDNSYDSSLISSNMLQTTEYERATLELTTNSSSINTSLYYPYNIVTPSDNCGGYWLASPSSYNIHCMCSVSYGGSIGNSNHNGTDRALRPIVFIQ